jgi:hypothetical protein
LVGKTSPWDYFGVARDTDRKNGPNNKAGFIGLNTLVTDDEAIPVKLNPMLTLKTFVGAPQERGIYVR